MWLTGTPKDYDLGIINRLRLSRIFHCKDNEILCKTDDGKNIYTFEILEGEGYKFVESKSSEIPKYKYSGDAKEALAPVADGAIFD